MFAKQRYCYQFSVNRWENILSNPKVVRSNSSATRNWTIDYLKLSHPSQPNCKKTHVQLLWFKISLVLASGDDEQHPPLRKDKTLMDPRKQFKAPT